MHIYKQGKPVFNISNYTFIDDANTIKSNNRSSLNIKDEQDIDGKQPSETSVSKKENTKRKK